MALGSPLVSSRRVASAKAVRECPAWSAAKALSTSAPAAAGAVALGGGAPGAPKTVAGGVGEATGARGAKPLALPAGADFALAGGLDFALAAGLAAGCLEKDSIATTHA